MEYAINLTETGYEITLNGAPWIVQPFDPNQSGFTPFSSPEAAQTHAEAYVASLQSAPVEGPGDTPQE